MHEHNEFGSSRARIPLSALDQRTVALEIALGGRLQTVSGRGFYEHDAELGGVLRIELAEEAGCEFLLVESSWNGEIRPGESLGCDYLIRLS